MKKRNLLKRDIILFKRGCIPALVLTFLLALICSMLVLALVKGSDNIYTPAKVVIVDQEKTMISTMAIGIVKNQGMISSLISVERENEETAISMLKKGECVAVIIIPDGLIGNIARGTDVKGKILLSKSMETEGTLVKEIAKIGEVLVAAGQFGVFSGEQLLNSYEIDGELYEKFMVQGNLELLNEAKNSFHQYFEFQETAYKGTSLTLKEHYIVCGAVIVLFLCGMFFEKLTNEDSSQAMFNRLRSYGVTRFDFMLGKVLYPFVFRGVIYSIFLIVVSGFGNIQLSLIIYLYSILMLLYLSILTTAITMCFSKGGGAYFANTVILLIGLLLYGGIIPRQLLPEIILGIGDVTPVGVVARALASIFGKSLSIEVFFLMVLYTIISIVAINIHLKRVERGGKN